MTDTAKTGDAAAPRGARHACLVSAGSGPVTVGLRVDGLLGVGGHFQMVSANEVIEEWRLAIDERGEAEHVCVTPPDRLGGSVLRFDVMVCSRDPNRDTGTVEVQCFQDGVELPCLPPTSWRLSGIPPCESDTAVHVRSTVEFVARRGDV